MRNIGRREWIAGLLCAALSGPRLEQRRTSGGKRAFRWQYYKCYPD
jgi:hypothetical protein